MPEIFTASCAQALANVVVQLSRHAAALDFLRLD
jgi:hypothetical protein